MAMDDHAKLAAAASVAHTAEMQPSEAGPGVLPRDTGTAADALKPAKNALRTGADAPQRQAAV